MIIVEDGTLVANANSYVTLVEANAYLADRGVSPLSDDELSPKLILAKDYLESYRDSFRGTMVSPSTQSLQWPRKDVLLYGEEFPVDAIPVLLKNAQCQLVIEQINGVSLLPTDSEPFVVKEEVGALKTTYSDKVSTSTRPSMPAVTHWLEPLLNFNAMRLTTLRI